MVDLKGKTFVLGALYLRVLIPEIYVISMVDLKGKTFVLGALDLPVLLP
jgi:hypothetical protein